MRLGDFGESTTTGGNEKKRRKTKKSSKRTMSILRLGRRKSNQRERRHMEWEKSETWGDRFHQITFVCFRKCGRHAGWLSASCFCAGVFFPIIFVSVAVARSVAFAGFGALIITALGFVLLTDFYFHHMPRCEKFCTLKRPSVNDDEDDLPRTIRGSPSWMAPEICRGKHGRANYGPAADVYSATICIWQILALEPLYPNKDVFDIMEYVLEGNRPPIPDEWPKDLKKLLQDGWHQDPTIRCTASELHRRIFALLPTNHPLPSHMLRRVSSERNSSSGDVSDGDDENSSSKTTTTRRSKSGRIKWPSIMSIGTSTSGTATTSAKSNDNNDDVLPDSQETGKEILPKSRNMIHPFDVALGLDDR